MPDGSVLSYDVVKNIVVPSKKNQKQIIKNKKTGAPKIISSVQFLKWQKQVADALREVYNKLYHEGISLPIARCKVKVLFYFADTKSRDLSNKWESIADELVSHGILLDDDFKVVKPIVLDGCVYKDRPRTEIYITIISPQDKEYDWDVTTATHYEKIRRRKALQAKIRYHSKRSGTPSP